MTGRPLFDIAETLSQFVADYKATITPALPIIMGGIVAIVGIKKAPAIFKSLVNKIG